jgi:glycerophosphoryl diester phosphodiesterase
MLCIGHRGAMGYEPENTLRSVRRALELGAQWIEVDVYVVQGRLMVFHDDRLERTTNGAGCIMEQSIDYLRSLDAGQGEKIPFLEEVVEAAAGRAGINVELKGPGTAEPVARFIAERVSEGWEYDQLLVSSFDHHELLRLKRLNPKVHLGALIVARPLDYALFAERLGAFSVNPAMEYVDQAFVDDAHKRGLKVFVFTVNNPEDITRMADLGVDGVFSNYPERVLAQERRQAN